MNETIKLNDSTKRFITACDNHFGEVEYIDRNDIKILMDADSSLKWPSQITSSKELRYGRGKFIVPSLSGSFENIGVKVVNTKKKTVKPFSENTVVKKQIIVDAPTVADVVEVSQEVLSLIPKKNPIFVKWGYFKDVISVLNSGKFYPIFVTGLSGNGKTFMIEQVCAELNRPMYRANITAETDEDDLLGGFRLIKGETVWNNGTVVEAMLSGSVLLLDEVDLGTEKLMCLQPVLEGKGVYIKKINKFIEPKAGFNIIATANTKGKGSDDGQFIGTNVMNEAFLERFPITLEQPYPDKGTEIKILTNSVALDMDVTEKESDFISKLVLWGQAIRKLYADGGIDEMITTRRLVHIVNAYSIFKKNRTKAIKMSIARFDDEVKTELLSFYNKIDATIEDEKLKKIEAENRKNNPKIATMKMKTPQETWGNNDDSNTAECPF